MHLGKSTRCLSHTRHQSIDSQEGAISTCHFVANNLSPGVRVNNQPITIVLPMHNAESQLQRSVREVLELISSFDSGFSVVIVDNGSTDETYESACELAKVYPQVSVMRQSIPQGLPSVMELVQRECTCEAVVVHDGVTPIDVDQLRNLLVTTPMANTPSREDTAASTRERSVLGSRRFGALRQLQANMEAAHASIAGFRWMRLNNPPLGRRSVEANSTTVVTAMSSIPVTQTVIPLA